MVCMVTFRCELQDDIDIDRSLRNEKVNEADWDLFNFSKRSDVMRSRF